MSTPFDPIKAQREIADGLEGVCNVIRTQACAAERRAAEAEAEFNALAKISRFAEGVWREAAEKLKQLVAEAEAQTKMGSPP